MAAGVGSSPSRGTQEGRMRGGIVLDIPVSQTGSSPRIPKRLRKRLLEEEVHKTPTSVEEIEAKLRDAHIRRQQFHETLSSKARPKPRSPSRSSSQEEDLGQRLEAKLQAAEQKRLNMLAKAQMRLTRLDELRQAAKNDVEMRCQREKEKLGTKVELRVQQAEANRMLMLKAHKQRRAILRERTLQSISRRMARRATAEKKRLGLLEAEKKRACARMLQVRRVAKTVSHQREVERNRMKDQLENRLQRAKRQRAEYLRQRGRQHNSVHVNWNRMSKQADILSRKLARCWRQFHKSRRTTLDLTKDYDLLKINENCIKSLPFEQLAGLIESTSTLQITKALMDRLESRLLVSKAISSGNNSPALNNIDHLLKRVVTPKKRVTARASMRNREVKRAVPSREASRSQAKLSRYPVRVVLCAYMILGHPDAVFSGQGEREIALAKSAGGFIREFELLVKIILDGPMQSSDEESDPMLAKRCTFRSQLAAFDKAWCSYLNCFVVWKVKDARSLEDDLVRAACQLELSMIQKCKMSPGGDHDALTHDMKAIQKQVSDDQTLLREKVQHLSGDAGINRMECALSETRSKYFQAKESGSPVGSPIAHLLLTSTSNTSTSPTVVASSGDRSGSFEGVERSSRVARSLFREDDTSSSSSSRSNSTLLSGSLQKSITENEYIVNEFVHECNGFVDRSVNEEDQNSFKIKIRKTMEEAFWDGIMESLKQDDPNYDQIIQLMREVRDGICEMAPESWKQGIVEAIDLDILNQVLESGNLDIEYLAKLLEFALGTLQKLSSPVHEDELKAKHQKLLKELTETCQTREEVKHSHATAMLKGLRFVLEQIQALKQEISKARIRMMGPLLKGPAGLDYLRRAFANRYGHHSEACSSLPLTRKWLSSTRIFKDQEWDEHINSLGNHLPEPESKGEKIDLLVRLGLLKLVVAVFGLSEEDLPETLLLNHHRLRAVQAEIQKVIVICTSILVCRQTLLMERGVANDAEVETIVSKCAKQLFEVLDFNNGAGIEEIVDVISEFFLDVNKEAEPQKLQSSKLFMARMLAKSLQAGDPVFEKVSRAVYLAARGVLTETALRQAGAAVLTERVVEAAEVLIMVARVTVQVHGQWYISITDDL
ncbi:hypothetical protein K2173_020665 [Erythroxylum novogranatense]|uniref:T-complex protein 11 n=1 Tax=Erythroxylum novogranatense TaxID=1862640 RepID=A0AAV8TLG3_9ROSI|nr:hypothetical protein K2173_020665 [Erythroxylum novogranatense]